MSVRSGLLALLAERPRYGAELKADFEARTGGSWPLNIGQVYTTLGRLERDGLVVQQDGPDAEGRITYALTDAGRDDISTWWESPVERDAGPRDELVIKVALAVTAPGVDVQGVVQRQRTATLGRLRELTRAKARLLDADPRDITAELVLEHHLFATESEVRWLDHLETRLARAQRTGAHDSDRGIRRTPSTEAPR